MDFLKTLRKKLRSERQMLTARLVKIDAVLGALNSRGNHVGRKRHKMSKAARLKISRAQKARWARQSKN